MNPSDSVQCMRSGNGVVRYSVGSLCEFENRDPEAVSILLIVNVTWFHMQAGIERF